MGDAYGSPASDDSSDIYGSPPPDVSTTDSPLETRAEQPGSKRKLPDEDLPLPEKRRKPEEQHVGHLPELPIVSGLPAEVWQSIFKKLHPMMLGRLMQVNRAFHRYLSDTKAHRWFNPRKGRLQVLDAETVWADSRKQHCPNMPKPLIDCHENDMWKLILGQGCMFCGKISRARSHPEKPFENGPGPDGVRTIWPFAVRTCGPCLERHSQKVSIRYF